MKLKILNDKHNIMSIHPEELPAELRDHNILFYWPRRDAIVINEGSQIFSQLADFTEAYLDLHDRSRKILMDELVGFASATDILKIERCLNKVSRIRRNLCRSQRTDRRKRR